MGGWRAWALGAAGVVALALIVPWILIHPEPVKLDDKLRATLPGSFVHCPDGWVHYSVSGPADGRPLVLIHGGLDSYPVFDPLTAALPQDRYRVIRFDLYGEGWSDRPATRSTLDLFDGELACVVETAGVKTAVDIGGWSLGGLVAAHFAASHPNYVRRLVLIAPAGVNVDSTLPSRVATMPVAGEYLSLWLKPIIRDRVAAPANRRYSPAYVRFNNEQQLRYLDVKGTRRSFLSLLRNTDVFGTSPAYVTVGRNGTPTLLLYGDHDQTVPPPVVEHLKQAIPDLRVARIDDASHGLVYDRARELAPRIDAFLTEN